MGTSIEEALPFLASTEHIRRDSLSLVQGEAAAIQPREPTNSRSLLYTSHFLSAWNCRLFEFGAVLFLAEAFPDTLLPSSIYAFVRAAAVIGFSPVIGDYIDIMDRLVVLRISIISHTMAVIVSCLVFLLIFAFEDSSLAGIQPLSLILLCLMAPIEKLASVMNSISIEKDWAVVIAKSDEIDLENINSQMRRIDLLCKLLGPLFIALVDGFSTRVAIWVVLVLSGFSVMLEYYTIAIVYSSVSALQAAPATSKTDANKKQALKFSQALKILRPISVYLQHPAFLPSIALSSLYFTVLSFSGQMITYLVSSGFAPTHVGIMRTTAAVFELSATWLAPWAIKQVGPIRAGLWSINWQLLCLIPTVILFFALAPPVNAALALIGGVIASRVGLWSFDLSVQIIVQEVRSLTMSLNFSLLDPNTYLG